MKGKVTEIRDDRSDGFKLVAIRTTPTGDVKKGGVEFYVCEAFVHEEFKIAVGDEVEFDVDEDGDPHITEVLS